MKMKWLRLLKLLGESFATGDDHKLLSGIFETKNRSEDSENLYEYFLNLTKKYLSSEYKELIESNKIQRDEKEALWLLMQSQVIIKSIFGQIGRRGINVRLILKFIDEDWRPRLRKLTWFRNQSIASAAKDAESAFFLYKLEVKNYEIQNFAPAKRLTIWIVLILVILYIILSLLNTATFVKWSLIGVFLIIMEMIRYERKREEDGTVKALIRFRKKENECRKRFIAANFLESEGYYWPETEELKLKKKKSLSKFYIYLTALLDLKRGNIPNKKEYKMYSHEYPKGISITRDEFQRKKEEFSPANKNHLFFIYYDKEKQDFFNVGNPFRISPTCIKFLRLLIINVDDYVLLKPLFEEIAGFKLNSENLDRKQRNRIQRNKRELIKTTFGKLDAYIEVEDNYGYKLKLEEGVKFFFIEDFHGFL